MNSWISRPLSACIAAVEDVHERRRQDARLDAAEVAPERQADGVGGGARDRQRDAEDGVRAQLALVGRAVGVEQHAGRRRPDRARPSRRRAGPSVWLTLSTAFETPLPSQRFLSPSRSSSASCSPVDAPLGTAARPCPLGVCTSTSTVGLPRESRMARARTALISLMFVAISMTRIQRREPSRRRRAGFTRPSRAARRRCPPRTPRDRSSARIRRAGGRPARSARP